MKRSFPFLIIFTVLVCGLLITWYFRRSATVTPIRSSERTAQTKGPAQMGAEPPHALGSLNAPVMLEEFADFECPACATLHPAMKAIKAEFGSRVVIVFRQFPMVSLHKNATAAARAAEAAGLQGKFWEMHDQLYTNQKTWHEAPDAAPLFEGYAAQIGLNLDQYRQDVKSESVEKRITLDRQRGSWIGVNGTPTVFLNGHEVPMDSLTVENLRALINKQ